MESTFEKICSEAMAFAKKMSKKTSRDPMEWLKENHGNGIDYLVKNVQLRISERTKILAYCVAAKYGVAKTNDLLSERGRERLYPRNLTDIAVMRCLQLGRDAKYLCSLMERITPLSNSICLNPVFMKDNTFCCTIPMMTDYLNETRTKSADGSLLSVDLTSELTDALNLLEDSDDDRFIEMLADKQEQFATIRERTRREFVRFLREFAIAVEKSGDKEKIFSLFMKEGRDSATGARKINFGNLALSVDNLFLGNLLCPENAYTNEEQPSLDDNFEREQDKFARLMRGFLSGKNDISRTFFLSLMLFFSSELSLNLDLGVLNKTLVRCGWRPISQNGKQQDKLDILAIDVLDIHNKTIPCYESFDVLLFDLEDQHIFDKYEGEGSTTSVQSALAGTLEVKQ